MKPRGWVTGWPACWRRPVCLTHAAMLLCLAVGGPGTVAAQDTASARSVALREQVMRPFRHDVHAELTCRGCHGSGARHRAANDAWTPATCAACHHDPDRVQACSACHDRSSYEPRLLFPARMALSVRESPETRALPFDHPQHAEFTCQTCHDPSSSDVRLRPVQCVTCHNRHHKADANCGTCHFPKGPEVHPLTVHLTCTGAGCHSLPPERQPVLSRPFCLMCHRDKQEHEPGGLCHTCHFVKTAPDD